MLNMFGKKEGRVPFTSDVVNKCMCDNCPVQAKSACSVPKKRNMTKMRAATSEMKMGSGMPLSMAQTPMEKMDMKPDELAGPFCTTGVASCRDLDMNKACICPSCQIYKEYNLKDARPVEHYCFNDKAV